MLASIRRKPDVFWATDNGPFGLRCTLDIKNPDKSQKVTVLNEAAAS